MGKLKNILYFYRILGWEGKMTGLGSLGYTILGYSLAGKFQFLPLFLNILIVFFGILFAFSINNYYDWKIQKERNFLGEKIREGKISQRLALFFCLLPLIFGLLILAIVLKFNLISSLSAVLLIFLFLLTFFYASPPLRLKNRKFLGFFSVPLGGFLIFLQGYFVFGKINFNFILLAILIFLFEIYLEVLHNLEDSLIKEEPKKIKTEMALKLLKILPLTSLFVSLAFSFYNLIFLNTSFFSLLRLFSLENFKIEKIHQIRSNFFSLPLSFYEFFIYGVFGLFHLI